MATHQHQVILLILLAFCIGACASPATTPVTTLPAPSMLPTATSATAGATVVAPRATPSTVPASPISSPSTTSVSVSPSPLPEAPYGAPTSEIVGTVVRFTAGSTVIDVTIGEDNPAVRDFLSMLPLTLTFEEFVGREKIAYLPRKLDHTGSPGSDPEDGDLIYYIPWGNLGFYYNTAGIGYSDQTIHFGRFAASLDQLKQLEGQPVTVVVVR